MKDTTASGWHGRGSSADVEGFHWPGAAYDGVAAIFVQFADPAARASLFEHIVRSLKPGGVLILQGYTPQQLECRTGVPPILSHLYTRELLEAVFASRRAARVRGRGPGGAGPQRKVGTHQPRGASMSMAGRTPGWRCRRVGRSVAGRFAVRPFGPHGMEGVGHAACMGDPGRSLAVRIGRHGPLDAGCQSVGEFQHPTDASQRRHVGDERPVSLDSASDVHVGTRGSCRSGSDVVSSLDAVLWLGLLTVLVVKAGIEERALMVRFPIDQDYKTQTTRSVPWLV